MKQNQSTKARQQTGLTLIELMVSLVLVGLITLATMALYTVAASTYKTTDDNQQLQDNARFIFEVLSQATRQAGLQDATQSSLYGSATDPPINMIRAKFNTAEFLPAPLFGYNNATVINTTTDFGAPHDNGGVNFSDVFGVRYFGSSRLDGSVLDPGTPDGSIIDCRGVPVGYPVDASTIGLSLFRIAINPLTGNEPELQCINRQRTGGPWSIVRGVETMQVMYAVDANGGADPSPTRWLNAQQVDTAALWPQVRMVRIGIVLRGSPGSAQTQEPVLYPLGKEFSSVGGTPLTESGLQFVPPNDGRLRKTFAFNLSIRNFLTK